MKHIMDNVTATGWVAKFKDARLQASGLSVYQWHEIVGRIENDERYGGKTTFGVAGFPHMAYDIDGKPLHFGGTICIVAVARVVKEEPELSEEPEPAFKVRDWVEFNPGNNPKQVEIVQIDGDKLYYNTMYAGKTIKTHIYASAITRKLDPSEVVVRIGCLSGTVAPGCSDTTIMIVPIGYNGIGDVAIIPVAMLDTPTRELVESLLKAQEEK